MRRDISRSLENQFNHPSDSATFGYAHHTFADIGRACDIWLKKHCPEPPKKRFGDFRTTPPKPPEASSDTGKIKVPREKKPAWKKPSIARYASDEERKEALRAIVKAHWASLTPEQKEARSLKSNRGKPKGEPRWKLPEQKAYKNQWVKEHRKANPLTEAELEARRQKAKAKYHEKNTPEMRAKIQERKRRAKEAKKEAGIQVSGEQG